MGEELEKDRAQAQAAERTEDRAQAAESIRRITATLSVKHKYWYAGGGGGQVGWSWRWTEPRLLRVSGELLLHCQSNASTGMQGGGRQVGELEDRAQAAESIRRITATLSVKCK